MGFSRQEYWSGLPFPSPGDLPNPGIEPGSPALQTDSFPSQHRETVCTSSKVKSESRCLSDSLRPPGLYSPWNSPGQNTSSKPTTRQDGFILQDTPLQGHSEPLGVLSPDPGVRSLRPPLKDADGEVSPSLTPLPPGWLLT